MVGLKLAWISFTLCPLRLGVRLFFFTQSRQARKENIFQSKVSTALLN
jgi:hypothetical protein